MSVLYWSKRGTSIAVGILNYCLHLQEKLDSKYKISFTGTEVAALTS